jgi:hypothetical protein
MNWMHSLAWFFGGAFLLNAIPHIVAGAMGRPFQSPFAKPRGEGLSSSTVNLVWGFANLVVAYLLILRVGEFDLRSTADAVTLGLGMLLIGLFLARHFGRFNGGNSPTQS